MICSIKHLEISNNVFLEKIKIYKLVSLVSQSYSYSDSSIKHLICSIANIKKELNAYIIYLF